VQRASDNHNLSDILPYEGEIAEAQPPILDRICSAISSLKEKIVMWLLKPLAPLRMFFWASSLVLFISILLRPVDVIDIFPSPARRSSVWVVVWACSHKAETWTGWGGFSILSGCIVLFRFTQSSHVIQITRVWGGYINCLTCHSFREYSFLCHDQSLIHFSFVWRGPFDSLSRWTSQLWVHSFPQLPLI
jgi:hypothetical protein